MKIWHSIPGFSRYQISATGKVRHKRHRKVLKFGIPANGYPQVNIYSDAKEKIISVCVHHLSAVAFLGPRPEGSWVRSRDGKKLNLHYKNFYYSKTMKSG